MKCLSIKHILIATDETKRLIIPTVPQKRAASVQSSPDFRTNSEKGKKVALRVARFALTDEERCYRAPHNLAGWDVGPGIATRVSDGEKR